MKKILWLLAIILAGGLVVFYFKYQPVDSLGDTKILTIEESSRCIAKEGCHTETILYSSGRLTSNTNGDNINLVLTQAELDKIKSTIHASGIMTKDCQPSSNLVDYYATYTFNIDGKQKTVQYDGCSTDLDSIKESLKL